MRTTTDGLGIGIRLDLPPLSDLDSAKVKQDASKQFVLGLGLGQPHLPPQMRWPYSTRFQSSSFATAYDSSPTPSTSSASSDSESSVDVRRASSGSATLDVLLNYLSPALSGEEDEGRKVYLLSSGLRNPKTEFRRSKSETFKFPLPPSKTISKQRPTPLKSALRPASVSFLTKGTVSPPLRDVSRQGEWRRHPSWTQLSPALEEARQGWSPYSSVAPTPRQTSGSQRFSLDSSPESSGTSDIQPPTYDHSDLPAYFSTSSASSCSSQTLVSDSETDSAAETDSGLSSDAAKLARLHASLLLLDGAVSELPLSLAETGMGMQHEEAKVELGGSVEEKMAYLCGLGYRSRRRKKGGEHAKKIPGAAVAKEQQSQEVDRLSEECEDEMVLGGKDGMRQGMVKSYAPEVVGANGSARVVSNSASAVTTSQNSPAWSSDADEQMKGEAEAMELEGDITIRQRFLPEPTAFEDLLGDDFSYLVDDSVFNPKEWQHDAPSPRASTEAGLITPPLTTPELGLDGASPTFLDQWPSPLPAKEVYNVQPSLPPRTNTVDMIEGCRPYISHPAIDSFLSTSPAFRRKSTLTSSISCPVSIPSLDRDMESDEDAALDQVEIAHARRTTFSTGAVLARPRPLRSNDSSNSLVPSASSDHLQRSTAHSVLARPRPIPSRSADYHSFANKSDIILKPRQTQRIDARPRLGVSLSEQTMPKSQSTTAIARQITVPRRKSSLDARAQAELHRMAEERAEAQHEGGRRGGRRERIVHPNSICNDVERADMYHSSASAYLVSHLSTSSPPPTREHLDPAKHVKQDSANHLCKVAGITAQSRRGRGLTETEGMSKSFSLPTLFTARTPSQRARGESGLRPSQQRRKSVVFVGSLNDDAREEESRFEPPQGGVLVVQQQVTTVGLAL